MGLFQYFEMVKGAIIVLIFPMEHSDNLGILNFNDIFTYIGGYYTHLLAVATGACHAPRCSA